MSIYNIITNKTQTVKICDAVTLIITLNVIITLLCEYCYCYYVTAVIVYTITVYHYQN